MTPASTSTACIITFPDAGKPRRYLTATSVPSTDRGRAKLFESRAAAEAALKFLRASLRATASIVPAE